jgi:hypothetical protein
MSSLFHRSRGPGKENRLPDKGTTGGQWEADGSRTTESHPSAESRRHPRMPIEKGPGGVVHEGRRRSRRHPQKLNEDGPGRVAQERRGRGQKEDHRCGHGRPRAGAPTRMSSGRLEQTLQQQRQQHRKSTAGAQIQRCFREKLEELWKKDSPGARSCSLPSNRRRLTPVSLPHQSITPSARAVEAAHAREPYCRGSGGFAGQRRGP